MIVEVSYLLFADSTLLFCDPCPYQWTYMSWVLLWFEAFINSSKEGP